MRARLPLARAPIALALAGLLTALALRSSLFVFLPQPAPPLLPLWIFLGALLALLPAVLARGSPAPAAFAATLPVIVAAAYGAGRLDWLRVLKDFDVQESAPFDATRLILSLAALATVYALHALDVAFRLRWRSLARGVPASQARAAFRLSLRRNATSLLLASAGALGILLIAVSTAGGSLRLIPSGRAALLAPILAAGLVALAGILLAAGRRDGGA